MIVCDSLFSVRAHKCVGVGAGTVSRKHNLQPAM